MAEPDDRQQLREFVETGSEPAFAALVERHLRLVLGTALRGTGNAHAAEEIAQAVFILLARKASSLGAHTALSGWLHHTARLTAANHRRGENRRRQREQEAFMQSTLNREEIHPADAPDDELWAQVAPQLDAALAKLGERDRLALVLRFLEGKTLREVGTALGASEDAAKVRVHRALEKLRKRFARRGITSTTTALTAVLTANSLHAAPAGLAQTVTAVALGKGAAATASILALMKMTMKTMTWMKIKFATGTALALLLAGGITTVAISQISAGGKDDKLTPLEIAQQSQAAYAALTSYSDTGKVVTEINVTNKVETTFNIRLQRPDLYRIEWASVAGPITTKGVVWGDGSGNYMVNGLANNIVSAKPAAKEDLNMALASATGVSRGAAGIIPHTFYNVGASLTKLFAPSIGKLQRLPDEKVGSIDCQVILINTDPKNLPDNHGTIGKSSCQFWIGKADHLIHQVKQTVGGMSVKFDDETLKKILESQKKAVTPEAIAALRAQMDATMNPHNNTISIETHENIQVNPPFTPADFAR